VPKDPVFESALGFARDLIRIPSPPGGEADVASRVLDEMKALGFDDVRSDAVGNVIGVVRGAEAGAPSVLVNSHLDVVAEGDPDAWEYPPFSGAVEGGFLHGRGAMDIKGPLALQTYAAAALRGRARGDVIVAHTVFEERGGLGMRRLLEAGEVKPDAVILGEATHGDVCVGHRGRAEIRVRIHGVAGHASAPERAKNALDLLPQVLGAIQALAGEQPSDPILGKASLVATGVEVLPESPNVIPDLVTVIVDWRILPRQTRETLVGQVEAAVNAALPEVPDGYRVEVALSQERQRTYTGVEEVRELYTPGFLMAPEHPVVRAATSAVGLRDGGTGPAVTRPWAFATDGGWSAGVNGIPTIGFAPGEERYAHTNRERLDLGEARWAFARYPVLIERVQLALTRGDSA
jgi:succinyl-diaminopimelate desuccinylase